MLRKILWKISDRKPGKVSPVTRETEPYTKGQLSKEPFKCP